ncbi:putative HTH cro/C1-type domain-containing protein [Vibrio owensii]|uniref:HTH cro/C1-type domain-containing protein n=2 Tax=Vibrio owensii TaxID=696485 RepID=A0AAU9Q944_9VIBR|nr:putative HTH cro/C1-type domain-containing protein [Vibrio owensii]
MFSKILKTLRKEKGFTQKELAANLSLASVEFESIDVVTISRWERGVTAPTKAKAIRILRCITTDVRQYLKHISDEDESKAFELFLNQVYELPVQSSTLAYIGNALVGADEFITHDHLLSAANDSVSQKLRAYHTNHRPERLELLNQDLFRYQEDERMLAYRFLGGQDKNVSLGHSIALLFDKNMVQSGTFREGFNINYRKVSRYVSYKEFSLYIVSAYFLSSDVFRYFWGLLTCELAKRANIEEVYVEVRSAAAAEYLISLGFNIVLTQNEVEIGGIKVGRRCYEKCLLKIDTSKLLSHQDSIALVRRFLT